MIRILHVIHGMNCGGAENMIMNLYRNTDRTKMQFDFLVHTDEKCFFDDEILKMGGRIYSVPYFIGINFLSYRKSVNNFFSSHPEYKIVHGHLGSCAHIYLSAAKKHGVYTILHSHNTTPHNKSIKNTMYNFFTQKAKKEARFFFACSKNAGEDRFGKSIVNSKSFKIIKNAIDTSKYIFDSDIRKSIQKKYDIENKFVVGHIGRFNEQKNHTFLIDIFKEIADIREDAVLLLVGDGTLKEEICKKVEQLNLKDKVIFTGVCSNVGEILQGMDCFVFPSHYEGLGIVAIESEAVGIPCFINDKLPEDLYINENVFGLSLGKSAREWAEFILKHTEKLNPEEAVENIRNAGYDIKSTVIELEDFYTKITEEEK